MPDLRSPERAELDQEKLSPLLKLRCRDSLADALADLGPADQIGRVFADFQKYLYAYEMGTGDRDPGPGTRDQGPEVRAGGHRRRG